MVLAVILGAIFGGIGLCVATYLYHAILDPPEFRGSGQWGLILLFILPLGAVLGALTFAGLHARWYGNPALTGWLWLLGGGLIAVLCLCSGFSTQWRGPISGFLLFLGLPFLWSVLLIIGSRAKPLH